MPNVRPNVSATDSSEPAVHMKVPVFHAGVIVNPKKPKAADYEEVISALIIRAAFEYEALVSTKDSFPDTALYHKWALKVWKNTTNDTNEPYEMTDPISSLVCP